VMFDMLLELVLIATFHSSWQFLLKLNSQSSLSPIQLLIDGDRLLCTSSQRLLLYLLIQTIPFACFVRHTPIAGLDALLFAFTVLLPLYHPPSLICLAKYWPNICKRHGMDRVMNAISSFACEFRWY
jgi:hypothetical protein